MSISFWNIEGLTEDLINETEFKTTFKSDVIAFRESWTTADSKLTVKGYVVEQSIRPNQTKTAGGIQVEL